MQKKYGIWGSGAVSFQSTLSPCALSPPRYLQPRKDGPAASGAPPINPGLSPPSPAPPQRPRGGPSRPRVPAHRGPLSPQALPPGRRALPAPWRAPPAGDGLGAPPSAACRRGHASPGASSRASRRTEPGLPCGGAAPSPSAPGWARGGGEAGRDLPKR